MPMKVKVVEPFRDKVTQKLNDTNAVIKVSEARYKEIKKYVVKVEK
jgi:hypothetical protein